MLEKNQSKPPHSRKAWDIWTLSVAGFICTLRMHEELRIYLQPLQIWYISPKHVHTDGEISPVWDSAREIWNLLLGFQLLTSEPKGLVTQLHKSRFIPGCTWSVSISIPSLMSSNLDFQPSFSRGSRLKVLHNIFCYMTLSRNDRVWLIKQCQGRRNVRDRVATPRQGTIVNILPLSSGEEGGLIGFDYRSQSWGSKLSSTDI